MILITPQLITQNHTYLSSRYTFSIHWLRLWTTTSITHIPKPQNPPPLLHPGPLPFLPHPHFSPHTLNFIPTSYCCFTSRSSIPHPTHPPNLLGITVRHPTNSHSKLPVPRHFRNNTATRKFLLRLSSTAATRFWVGDFCAYGSLSRWVEASNRKKFTPMGGACVWCCAADVVLVRWGFVVLRGWEWVWVWWLCWYREWVGCAWVRIYRGLGGGLLLVEMWERSGYRLVAATKYLVKKN